MRTTDRSRARKGASKTDTKRHQITLDDDRWEWLEALPGGASKGLRDLIDLARERGLVPGEATVTPAAATDDLPVETVLEAVADAGIVLNEVAEAAVESLSTDGAAATGDAAEVVAAADVLPASLLDALDLSAYVPGATFHVPGAKVYAGTLGPAVNKQAAQMARVVYEPAHFNAAAEGMWRGAGRDFATWIFAEEPGLNERLLESGLELLMDVTLEPGASVGYHVHRRTEEIYYLLAGSLTVATVATDGSVHTEVLHQGDAHLVRRGQGHSCEAGADGCRFITVAGRL